MIATPQRSEGIDVLRGLAVILVVLSHIHLRFRLNHYEVAGLLPEPVAAVLFKTGLYSVTTFFVISGFLITTLSLRRWQSLERMPLLPFYRLRAARILPCLFLLLAILSVLHLAGVPDYMIMPERASLGQALFSALTFHLNWLEGKHGYLPGSWDVLWSLSVEEAFYVLFPLVCIALRREHWALLAIAALIVIGPINRVALLGQVPWDHKAYLSTMDGIAFGCCAAWIAARVPLGRLAIRLALLLGTAAASLILLFRPLTTSLGLTKLGLNVTVLELGIALVLLALANGPGNATLSRGTGLLRWAGRCSYEIYLTHMFVILALMHPFKSLFGERSPQPVIFWLFYAVMLVGSCMLGFAVERWISSPLNRLLRGRQGETALEAPPASVQSSPI